MARPIPSLDRLLISQPADLYAATSSEELAMRYVEGLRWPGRADPDYGVPCTVCGRTDTLIVGLAKPAAKTRSRRLWRCRDCSKNWTVRTGTRFEGGQVPLRHVLLALWLTTEGHDQAIDLEHALGERTELARATCLRLANETLEALGPLRAEDRRRRRVKAWGGAGAAALALIVGGWGVARAAEPDVLLEEWTNGGQVQRCRTSRMPGEEESEWRRRHSVAVASGKLALPEDS